MTRGKANMRSFIVSIALLAVAVPAVAQQAPALTAAPAPAINPDAYVLGVNDEVQITVFGRADTAVTTRIAEDGTVTFPYVGAVKAQGETPRSLSAKIADKLKSGGYFTNPIVNVDVKSFISNAVTVFGNVNTPGVLPLDRQLTVAMMVARAGGARADASDYAILRRAGEPERKIYFEDLSGTEGSSLQLKAGDTLFVPQAQGFYVYGQVNSPGQFPVKRGLTVRQALARAGGPTLGGSEKKVSLFRNGKLSKHVPLEEVVQAEDVLRVGERLF